MMNDKIRINFYPLINQEFEYKLWRRNYSGERREDLFANLYRNTLPIDENLDERKDYWISFESQGGFEDFTCKSCYNYKLTQHYLYHLLYEMVKNNLSEVDYILPQNPFRKTIYFVLKEHAKGKEVVWLEPYYLPVNRKFGFLADFKFFKDPDTQFSREIQRLSLSLDSNYRSNRNFYLDKYQKLQEFKSKFRDKLFPLNNGINISWELENLLIDSLKTKSYIFANEQTRNSQFKGLEEVGPLEKITKSVTLIFIYRRKDKYLIEDLIEGLRGNLSYALFNGLEKMFRMDNKVNIHSIPLSDFSEPSLDDAIRRIGNLQDSNSLFIPVLILDKPADDYIYYNMKYKLLKESLPIQVVTTTQVLRKRDVLKWSISNIALQIFAKLGGKPWKVKPSSERSIIFGIGQAHQKVDGTIIKYFAYSICTDSSGIYKKIDVLGNSESEKDYLNQLKDNIIKTIEEYIHNEYKSVVLHIPFKIKRKEIETIHKAIEEYVENSNISDVDFVVLRVNQKSKYFGYAYTNSLVPYESTYILLSNNPPAYLVWFEGLQYHRDTIFKRVPGPIYIEFYWTNRNLSNQEMIRYLQDVLNLSGANWRGFNAKNVPISIYYCELITRFLKNFPAEIENMADIINPWFL